MTRNEILLMKYKMTYRYRSDSGISRPPLWEKPSSQGGRVYNPL